MAELKMAPATGVMTRPDVSRKYVEQFRETRPPRFRYPELLGLNPAAGRSNCPNASGIMVFYFTSSSGEWSPKPSGSLPRLWGSEAETSRPLLAWSLSAFSAVGASSLVLMWSLHRVRPSSPTVPPRQCLVGGEGARGTDYPLSSLCLRTIFFSLNQKDLSLPGIRQFVVLFTLPS